MRVSFSVPLAPLSGKHNFAMRLANALSRRGVVITDRKPDVNLVFVKGARKGCKNILRLDGVLINTDVNYVKKNKSLLTEMKKCDGVIYQNDFCKKSSDVFLRPASRHAIILNGAPFLPDDYPQLKWPRPYLLAAARWRPHKRLRPTINGFLDSGLAKQYDLIIMGNSEEKQIHHKAIKYLGQQPIDEVLKAIQGAKFCIHLAWLDWCPNFVVECLSARKRVLHTSSGGTKYVVKKTGVTVKDAAWDFKPLKLYSPPVIDRDELAAAYCQCALLPDLTSDDVRHIHIDDVAARYKQFMVEVLEA